MLGRDGSGKTTLLKLIHGQIEPISGAVSVHVRSGMLDQSVTILDKQLSVLENFILPNPGSSDNACRAALAGFLFRADAAHQKVGELSGGSHRNCSFSTSQPIIWTWNRSTQSKLR